MIIAISLVSILCIYAFAKIVVGSVEKEPTEADQVASKNRMVQYSTWLKGGGRERRSGCLDKNHSPMVLFNQKDRTKIDSVICGKCTDTLPTPVEYSCGECWVTGVDGYLHVEPCAKHDKELVS